MRRLCVLLLFLVLTASIQALAAQESSTVWPPETPEDLFGPRVEIVDFHLESGLIRNARDSAFIADDYRAVITNAGKIYPWPDGIPFATRDYVLPDGLISDQVYLAASRHQQGEVEVLWRLDLTTGSYTRLNRVLEYVDTFCGRLRFNSALINDWMVVTGVNGQQHLCDVSTGTMSNPLPPDYQDWQIHHSQEPNPYVLVSAAKTGATGNMVTLFAFDLANRELLRLGEFERGDDMRVVTILNDTMQILGIMDTTNNVERAYLINLADHRLFPIPGEGAYREDPPRLEYYKQLNDDTACEISVMDLLTEKQVTYELNSRCFAEEEHGAWHYYRILNESGSETDVIRVDVLTGERVTLFTGEVEQIGWISTDERYAALVMDYDGEVDTPPGQMTRVSGSPNVQMVLFDLATGDRLFEVPAATGGIFESWYPIAYSVSENQVAIGESVIQIEDGDIVVSTAKEEVGREIGNGWVITTPEEKLDEYGNVASHGLYNVDTQEEVALVDLGKYGEDYWIYEPPVYIGDNQFQVTLGFGGGYDFTGVPPLYNLAIYTVRVEDVTIEAEG
ncbi:MAG TPA: hypothetical protein VHO69_17240 [Phototrophicaceae bacterium]|nr:hypothetical protein [Phototrophicaceae bacterium]